MSAIITVETPGGSLHRSSVSMAQVGRTSPMLRYGIRIYLAGRYSRREELAGYAEEIRSLGYAVDCRWLLGTHQYGPDSDRAQEALEEHDDMARRFALEDVEDLRRSDVVISFTEPPRKMSTNRGGRHVEFGLGLAYGKDVIVVGWRENAFHYLPDVQFFPTWEGCLEWLQG